MSVAQLSGGRPLPLVAAAARRDPVVVGAAAVVAVVALVAVVGPALAPYGPDQLYSGPVLGPPSAAHPFGTDDLGRDVLSRLLAGARASVVAPVAVVALSSALGLAAALVGGWFGGVVDAALARVIEVAFAIPGLVLAVLAVAVFGKGLLAPVVALSVAYTPIVSRLMRAAVRAELAKPYVSALRVQGVSAGALLMRHLVPAVLPALVASATVGFGYAMLDLAAISYLGLGQQPPDADWGVMIAAGQASILTGAVEQSLFPAVMVVLTVVAVNVVGARATDWAEAADR